MDAVDHLAAPPGSVAAGARAMAPVVVGYVPFALLVGAHVATSADPLAAWLGTSTIYGGAAQLAVLDVLAGGGSVVAAALTGLLLQARLAVYAAALAPDWRSASLPSRLLAAFTLTDVPWALSQAPRRHRRDVAAASALLSRRGPDPVGGVAGDGHRWERSAARCWRTCP